MHRRFDPVPEIPDYEVYENVSEELKPIKPNWDSRRCGVLGYKMGCMNLWDEWGERHHITVVKVDRCVVLEQRTLAKHGYEAVQLGLGYRNVFRQSKPNVGRYIKLGVGPKHIVKEFKCTADCHIPVGHFMSVRHFVPGMWVFVSGWTKGKGWDGPVGRWGFARKSDAHGTEKKAHRSHGSTGRGHSADVVWRFKKMGGHVGPDPRIVNCRVFRIESARNLLFLKGVIPGHKGQVCKISDARGVTFHRNGLLQNDIPHPTFVPEAGKEYPVTLQMAPQEADPFLYPDRPFYDAKK